MELFPTMTARTTSVKEAKDPSRCQCATLKVGFCSADDLTIPPLLSSINRIFMFQFTQQIQRVWSWSSPASSIFTSELWTLQRDRGGWWRWVLPKLERWTATNIKVHRRCNIDLKWNTQVDTRLRVLPICVYFLGHCCNPKTGPRVRDVGGIAQKD